MSEDFAELFASYESERKTALKAGDKVSGTVISIGPKSFLSIAAHPWTALWIGKNYWTTPES